MQSSQIWLWLFIRCRHKRSPDQSFLSLAAVQRAWGICQASEKFVPVSLQRHSSVGNWHLWISWPAHLLMWLMWRGWGSAVWWYSIQDQVPFNLWISLDVIQNLVWKACKWGIFNNPSWAWQRTLQSVWGPFYCSSRIQGKGSESEQVTYTGHPSTSIYLQK